MKWLTGGQGFLIGVAGASHYHVEKNKLDISCIPTTEIRLKSYQKQVKMKHRHKC